MRLLILAVLVASVTCVSVRQAKVGNSVYDDDWELYKITYNKKYETLEEEVKRRLIFEDNMALIKRHNLEEAKGQHTYKMGLGPFTDMTIKEFGETVSCLNMGNMPPLVKKSHKPVNKLSVPSSVDWRQKGVVTSIKNQGNCGSCWAFSTVGCVESRYAIENNVSPIDLSAQQLVDCDSSDHGCQGGNPITAFQYMEQNGVEKWSDYPYAAVQQQCTYQSSRVAVHVSDANYIYQDESSILPELANNGPVAVVMHANYSAVMNYQSGIIDDPSCPTQMDHGVIAVGYGSSSGKDYWIIKNSWGAQWGENGYFRIVRNKNMCGIGTLATFGHAS